MCGINGYIFSNKLKKEYNLKSGLSRIRHRGPDNLGVFESQNNLIQYGLGHVRLSILDLSDAASQPMRHKDLLVSFNGEIYNFKEIQSQLASLGHDFRTSSDTEVILHAFDEWGVDCVHRFVGMFAFAILDLKHHCLWLMRDRVGVKPLYYKSVNNSFEFASELKGLPGMPVRDEIINLDAVHSFVNLGYVPEPLTIFDGVKKLKAGSYLKLSFAEEDFEIVEQTYWNVESYYNLPKMQISYDQAKVRLKRMLKDAFGSRLVSDVPVGLFLSGGIDSSLLTSILSEITNSELKTFTIGFNKGNDESRDAQAISSLFNTIHKVKYCDLTETKRIIEELPNLFDEPFADSSAIPTLLVSELAKANVTVALSADGGDEIFAGYKYYRNFVRDSKILRKLPRTVRQYILFIVEVYFKFFPRKRVTSRLNKYTRALRAKPKDLLQELHNGYFLLPEFLSFELLKIKGHKREVVENKVQLKDPLSFALCKDFKNYMLGDILTKVDRSTMKASLEGREPFLDHRLIEFAATLPNEMKLGKKWSKAILRDILKESVPEEIVYAPKRGFEVPIMHWLKTDLSYLIDKYLSLEYVREVGFFNEDIVVYLVNEFKARKLRDETVIWRLLQFHMWYSKR